MSSLTKPQDVSWARIAKRTWQKTGDDDVFGRSAQLAYYFFLALFPMLIFLISTLGVFPGAGESVRHGMFQFLGQALPAAASELIQKTMDEVTSASGIGKLSFGLIVSLWSASAGMLAIMDTLNAEHGVTEKRSFLRQRVTAVLLTLSVAMLLVLAAAIALVGQAQNVLTGTFSFAWKIAHWPIAACCVLGSLALIYYFAPNLKKPEWHWITPGAVVGLLLWLLASIGLRIYLHYFNSYSATYGSLGAVIILLLSFYITGIAILIGGEVNVVIEEAVVQNSGTHRSEDSTIGRGTPKSRAAAV
jgi:membrane protein